MIITDITLQARNPDRVNISVDGKYRFSLDIFQVTELGIKKGREYSEEELAELEDESSFGKLYARALEYTLMRPHSAREVRDYLWKKIRTTKVKTRQGELKDRPGVSQAIVDRVYDRLVARGYVDDEKFAKYWVENRNMQKGISARKLHAELIAKGVERSVIEAVMQDSPRDEKRDLQIVLQKKKGKYAGDERKLIAYLMRQGFAYDDIREALTDELSG